MERAMKIAFVGKGGSGKTTLSSLFTRYLGSEHAPVVAIDADINQHLGVALGMSEEEAAAILPLGLNIDKIKQYLRGTNRRIGSVDEMLKSTPAGAGSNLLRVNGDDPVHQEFGVSVAGATLLATGPFSEDDLGLSCYHSKIGAAELYLNHVVDDKHEYVVMDMTAGADAFASGLFTRFDVTFLVAEPTRKGVSVYRQYSEYAKDHDVKIKVIGNKIQGEDDLLFLQEAVGDDLLAHLMTSKYVKSCEKGRSPTFAALEPHNLKALQIMRAEVDATPQNWQRFTSQGAYFHRLYAKRWSASENGVDPSSQIDPHFTMGPQTQM